MLGSKTKLVQRDCGAGDLVACGTPLLLAPLLAMLLVALQASIASAAGFSGASALEYTRRAVAFGPRPAGSEANTQLRAYIVSQLKALRGVELIDDSFVAKTPKGDVPMHNILARFPGKSRTSGAPIPAIVVTGHFDTKPFPAPRRFVGANDGGSSTGLLL